MPTPYGCRYFPYAIFLMFADIFFISRKGGQNMENKDLQYYVEQIQHTSSENVEKMQSMLLQTQNTLQQTEETVNQINREYNRIIDSLCDVLAKNITRNPDSRQANEVRSLIEDCQSDSAQLSLRGNIAKQLIHMNVELLTYAQERMEKEKELLDIVAKIAQVKGENKQVPTPKSSHMTETISSKAMANVSESVMKILQEDTKALGEFSKGSDALIKNLQRISKSVTQAQTADGWSIFVEFENGYGADIAKNSTTYGSKDDLWEIAVTKNGELYYKTPITNDVIGGCTENDVLDWCLQIAELEQERDETALKAVDLDYNSPDL